jgi:hypothetical protein
MDVGSVHIRTPLGEKRIASVYRGLGPRTGYGSTWESFDAFLLRLAEDRGAHLTRARSGPASEPIVQKVTLLR